MRLSEDPKLKIGDAEEMATRFVWMLIQKIQALGPARRLRQETQELGLELASRLQQEIEAVRLLVEVCLAVIALAVSDETLDAWPPDMDTSDDDSDEG